ncbi:tRNA nucleotidyltransferase (CCA-adding enzyme) [Candidatus Methanophagaceae archaeon]|nr:tRNA nucleotidyltransferase (CCA-adding enzyme) [Methanophagales archaeon]
MAMIDKKEEIKRICKAVIERIKPNDTERENVKAITNSIITNLNTKALELGITANAISVGSTVRNTWVSGEADIDIFLMFPVDMSEEDLKEKGLTLAKSVSERYEERYASHPYIHAYFYAAGTEHEMDIVPCFAVKEAALLKSAVDRTPFHTEYVVQHISGLEDEVLLLKQFMKCLGIYGSEQRRKGLSGYLCELLILKYSSFVELLANASQWQYGVRIDLEGHGKYRGEEPLIVIDPVDPKRNVAAAVSLYSFCKLIDTAREFLAQPDRKFFMPHEGKPMSEAEIRKLVKARGTEFVTVMFDVPDVVEDQLFPQLRKAEASIRNLIERNEFRVYRSDVTVEGGKAILVFEFLVWQLPKLKQHMGPPVTSEAHAAKFKSKHSPPYLIENGKYAVEVERKYTDVVSLLEHELNSCSLGKDVSESVEKGYEVLKTEEIRGGLGYFFSVYFGVPV